MILFINNSQTIKLLKYKNFKDFIDNYIFYLINYYTYIGTQICDIDFILYIINNNRAYNIIWRSENLNKYIAIFNKTYYKFTCSLVDRNLNGLISVIKNNNILQSFIFLIIYEGDDMFYVWK